jgi:hypothetical protein
MSGLVAKLVAKADADVAKVKDAIRKAVYEVDSVVLPEAAKVEPIVAAAAEAISPGGSSIVNVAYEWLEECAKVLDSGGAATEESLTNAGLDVAAIQSVKALIPQLKATVKAA